MAIYHLEEKIISRGTGRSACAAAAYMSCSRIYNDYDGIQHDYARKQGLVWQQVFLLENAPPEWQDREILWNAVEENEKTKDSRLAREIIVALPRELSPPECQALLTDYIQDNFVSDGMCADVCIHDTDGHNPHAHIMLTVRPLDKHGKWQYKTQKEYLCIRNGEERGFTAEEWKTAQTEGWEKQYPYKTGKGKKQVYLPPSKGKSKGLIRASKYPKSTKYGRQNPISEHRNSEEQLVTWRAAWADISNQYLARANAVDRIDHRSHAARGLDEKPTIHEGVTARALERKGIVSDRCKLNRQIKTDNALLRELKAMVAQLVEKIAHSVPAIVDKLEALRGSMVWLQYQWIIYNENLEEVKGPLKKLEPLFQRYRKIKSELKALYTKKRTLLAEKKGLGFFDLKGKQEVSGKIATVVNEIEELKSEKLMVLKQMGWPEEKDIPKKESAMKKMQSDRKSLENTCSGLLDQYEDERRKYEDVIYSVAPEDWSEVISQQDSQHYQERIDLMNRIKADQGEYFSRNVFDQAEIAVSQGIRFIQQEYRDRNAPVLQQIRQREQQRNAVRNDEVQQQKRQRRRQQER